MEEVSGEHRNWKQEWASLVDSPGGMNFDDSGAGDRLSSQILEAEPAARNVREAIGEFARGLGEMSLELARSFADVVKQSLGDEDSFVTRKVGKPCGRVLSKLRFLNEYLPEDRNPVHSWGVIFLVFFVAMAALSGKTAPDENIPVVKLVHIHPPSASHILLPDGRRLAYHEQGLPAIVARFCVIVPHSFLFSRLTGVPGLKTAVMEEFGIRLISYDLPGFGESDPHPQRTLESSALDILHLADALQVHDKFWLFGYSSGSIHVWAALRYIPDRLAGAAMFAPMVNPYDPSMTKEERSRVWSKWTSKRTFMYLLARRVPKCLAFFYRRSFFSGKHASIDKLLSLSLGKKDKVLIEDPKFEEFWQRSMEESIRQGNVKPFVEESVLQVSNWKFKISELQAIKKQKSQPILLWLKSLYSQEEEERIGFLGPIHIWQGMDDRVVPPAVTSFVHRNLPGATVHMLPNEGHFTYFYFCDECHRQIFSTIFGAPLGPLQGETPELDPARYEEQTQVLRSFEEETLVKDSTEPGGIETL
ncbi:hypothetical protein V2J09_002613 [Rumex salicifolius]